MAKRMIVMLAVAAVVVGSLGFVKFQQIQTAIAQGAAFQPPPEAVTTIVAAQETWPATLEAIGTMAAVQGVTVSADLPGTVDRISFDSGRVGPRGRGARPARHAAGAGAAGRRRSRARAGPSQLRKDAGPAERTRHLTGGVRPGNGRAETDGGPSRGNPRRDRSENHPGALCRDSRDPAGESGAIPRPAATRSSRCSR